MGPIETLMQEHEVIASALADLRMAADRLERGDAIPSESLLARLDFFTSFADARHHIKEEELLFPALIEAGLPESHGPIPVMLHEHEIGRALVKKLQHCAADTDRVEVARRDFVDAARQYAMMLGEHIHKENNILFRLAQRVLTPQKASELEQAFERLDRSGPRAAG